MIVEVACWAPSHARKNGAIQYRYYVCGKRAAAGLACLPIEIPLGVFNQAKGSPGEGGGVYNLGTLLTIILFNKASTNGDNIGP
jgi:hypothetical protein